MMGDIYIAAHLRRCLRHSVIGHVLQYTPSPSVLDALHLRHAVKSPPLRHPSPSHRAFIETKNEHVKTKDIFQMKISTHTIMYQAKFAAIDIETIMYPANFAGGRIETIMYPANFAGGRSRLDLLLPSFLPSREEKKKQERRKQSIDSGAEWHTPHTDRVRIETKMQKQIFCPLRGHVVGRMQYAPTACRQETLFPINSREERIETKIQEQKNRPLGSRGVFHTPPKHLERDETKMQNRIFCPLRGHAVGRMQYAPTSYRQEMLFQINSLEERTETKIQDQKNRPLGCRGVLHMPHMDRVRTETNKQDRIFCPLRGHAVGRMQYAPTSCRQETLFPINSREERIETKIQEQKNRPLGSRGVFHTPPKHLERDETKMQNRIFCPLRGHAVGRMQYAPTSYRQEMLFQINSLEERTETKIQDQKNRPLGCRGVSNTPPKHLGRDEQKIQNRIFCPLRGHAVGRMQYAPTTCRQEMLFPINSREERIETKIQKQKNHPLGSRGVLHTPHMDRVRTETKMQERRKQSIDSGAEWHNPHMDRVRTETKIQDRIFCPLRGHAVGRMQYAPTSCWQETLFPINSREERIETKMQEQKNYPLGSRGVLHTPHMDRVRTEKKIQERIKQSIDSGAEWHTPFMRQGKRDAVWRDTFLDQRACVAIWRDRHLEEKSSHARFQMRISRENSKLYKSSLVALSEQLRDIFTA